MFGYIPHERCWVYYCGQHVLYTPKYKSNLSCMCTHNWLQTKLGGYEIGMLFFIGIVQAASVVGVLTNNQRIAPVMDAVLAQIKLNADFFSTFIDVLRRENSALADSIQQSYGR